jgi:uncharacterized protein (DUF4415 family)
VDYEWDDAKNARNLRERGIPFESVWNLDWERTLVMVDERRAYPETRYVVARMDAKGSAMKSRRPRARSAARDTDSPELVDRDFARMRPAEDVVPDVVAAYRRSRGRPRQAQTKQLVSLRLSPEVLAHFRGTGPGWQTRIDDALRSHVRRRRTTGGRSKAPSSAARAARG